MPFDHEELNSEAFNYGVTTFSSFFNSLLIVAHFVFLVGWSSFTYTVKINKKFIKNIIKINFL